MSFIINIMSSLSKKIDNIYIYAYIFFFFFFWFNYHLSESRCLDFSANFDKMLKWNLIPIVLNLQCIIVEKNNNSNELLEEIRKFNDNFSKLQSDLSATKHANAELNRQWPWNFSAGQIPSTPENNVWK